MDLSGPKGLGRPAHRARTERSRCLSLVLGAGRQRLPSRAHYGNSQHTCIPVRNEKSQRMTERGKTRHPDTHVPIFIPGEQ